MHVQILMVEIVLRIAKFWLRVPELCLDLEVTSLRVFRSVSEVSDGCAVILRIVYFSKFQC